MSTDQRPIVAFDESGNTGCDLLNREQPVFVLASVHMTDEIAHELVGKDLKELKFSKFKKSTKGRQKILEILSSPHIINERVVVTAYHKPFLLVSKIVDILLKPYGHIQGIDVNQQGRNIALANVIYIALAMYLGKEGLRHFLSAFVAMIRTPSEESVESFYNFVAKLALDLERHPFKSDDIEIAYAHVETNLNDALEVGNLLSLIHSTRPVAQNLSGNWNYEAFEPAIAALMTHASAWTERLASEFRLVHDPSKPIARSKEYIKAMMSVTEPTVKIGFDRRTLTLPIRSSEVEFCDSIASCQIQVADIVASALMYILKIKHDGKTDPFAEQLQATRIGDLDFQMFVWPEPKVTPEELGTIGANALEPIQYMLRRIDKHFRGDNAHS